MSNNYRYDHRSHKNKKRHAFIITSISLLIVAGVVIAIVLLINQTTKKIKSVSGQTEVIGTVTGNPASSEVVVNEPYYTFNLPNTWKEIKSVSDNTQNSITWESFEKNSEGRTI